MTPAPNALTGKRCHTCHNPCNCKAVHNNYLINTMATEKSCAAQMETLILEHHICIRICTNCRNTNSKKRSERSVTSCSCRAHISTCPSSTSPSNGTSFLQERPTTSPSTGDHRDQQECNRQRVGSLGVMKKRLQSAHIQNKLENTLHSTHTHINRSPQHSIWHYLQCTSAESTISVSPGAHSLLVSSGLF